MKKYSFILCIALVAFVVASCGLKGNHTSSGHATPFRQHDPKHRDLLQPKARKHDH